MLMRQNQYKQLSHVFGPVPSRRLGYSLGVDVIQPKTCKASALMKKMIL